MDEDQLSLDGSREYQSPPSLTSLLPENDDISSTCKTSNYTGATFGLLDKASSVNTPWFSSPLPTSPLNPWFLSDGVPDFSKSNMKRKFQSTAIDAIDLKASKRMKPPTILIHSADITQEISISKKTNQSATSLKNSGSSAAILRNSTANNVVDNIITNESSNKDKNNPCEDTNSMENSTSNTSSNSNTTISIRNELENESHMSERDLLIKKIRSEISHISTLEKKILAAFPKTL